MRPAGGEPGRLAGIQGEMAAKGGKETPPGEGGVASAVVAPGVGRSTPPHKNFAVLAQSIAPTALTPELPQPSGALLPPPLPAVPGFTAPDAEDTSTFSGEPAMPRSLQRLLGMVPDAPPVAPARPAALPPAPPPPAEPTQIFRHLVKAPELAALLPDIKEQESRLTRAQKAYSRIRGFIQLHGGDPELSIQLSLLDKALGWGQETPGAPDPLPEPPVGWNDPEDVVQVKVQRTFPNPRFVSVQAPRKKAEEYLWLGPRDYRPRPGESLSVRPNPDEKIGGYILYGDYNRRGLRLA